ncbi:dihydrofolate reductase family protein [Mesorhizobium sp. Z1-4]|uniref:dihydrofolate reductase family protein n=1 Tax=Mesorhizobium sp. Z1-4 TaxID=2448478 RepID=UPI0013DECB46|nr:dihydrofolate reductase family protein [Mesorhizobium sp. Z1-4]
MSGKIIATQYMSLDGVIEDPVGMENTGLGDWTGPFSRGPEGDKFKEDELLDAGAMIFGRRTYDGFAAVWPLVDTPYAERMNALPKFLASSTISAPEWNNTTLLGKDLPASVRKVKASVDGNILIFGSASVCHTLLAAGLIDELSLMVYPTILGKGIRLFPDGVQTRLEQIENVRLNDGIALLRYRTVA